MLTNRVKEFKKIFRLTTVEIAQESGVPLGTVRALAYRKTHVPTDRILKTLAAYFGLTNPLELLVWVPEESLESLESPEVSGSPKGLPESALNLLEFTK
jgi:transcriptional regulator with XRE-family HTH domain